MSNDSPSAACAVLVRNAQNTILDWISWHLSLGFKHIFVIDAGSNDNTIQIVQSLAEKWPITYSAPNVPVDLSTKERRQYLTDYALSNMIGEEEWITVLDSDEFLSPEPNLSSLLKRAENAAGIVLNWCIYGTGGHQYFRRGHIVSSHQYRANTSLPDHGFTRIIARSSYLTSTEHKKNPEDLDIPIERLVRADGTPAKENDLSPHWEGGRILHYVCSAAREYKGTYPLLWQHFNRNDVKDPAPETLISKSRHKANIIARTLFEIGIRTLHTLASDTLELPYDAIPKTNIKLPEKVDHSSFSYERIRPSRRDQLLLVPQVAPPYGITRTFLLRSSDNNNLLEADPKGSNRPLIAFIQEHHPRLLTIMARDEHDFILGDIPSSYGIATVMSRRTHNPEKFSLPEESGYGNTLFSTIPLPDVVPPKFVLLPPLDKKEGLSLNGLLLWIATHPDIRPQDIQRALMLLTENDAQQLRHKIPELNSFL